MPDLDGCGREDLIPSRPAKEIRAVLDHAERNTAGVFRELLDPRQVRARPGFKKPVDFRRRIGRHRNRGAHGKRKVPKREKRLLHFFRDARLRNDFNREAESLGTAGFCRRERHEVLLYQLVVGEICPKRIELRAVAVQLRCRELRRMTNAPAPGLRKSPGEKRLTGGIHQAFDAGKGRFPGRHRGLLPVGRTFASSSA